jgi:hypothetical protein
MNYIAIDYTVITQIYNNYGVPIPNIDYEYYCTDPAFFRVQEYTEKKTFATSVLC